MKTWLQGVGTRLTRRPLWRSMLVLSLIMVVLAVIVLPTFDATAAPGAPLNVKRPAAAAPNAANVNTLVQVPASMKSSPFNTDRYLSIPPNFTISVYARIGGARFMATTPDGNLLVSQPGSGKVSLVRPNAANDPLVSDFVTGLRKPHDIVFHTIGTVTYVYISETHQINRYIWNNGDLTAHDRQIVITGLPDSSTPELRGSYGHELKNIALDGNHKLYVSIASTCNACTSDTTSDPVRGAIYQYNADGTGGRLYARGLRNAEGLAFIPGTNNLWVVVNNRDNIACPTVNASVGCNNVGDVSTAYVDNHPPEEFTAVADGANYGWPFCNPNPDSGVDNMPFDRDQQFNADGSALDCNAANRISKGIQAHSAPLGLTFLQGTNFPAAYRNGAVTALHGSWNRSTPTGYKIAYFPWNSTTQTPGAQVDFVTGWLVGGSSWGRPVDTAVDPAGNLLISDDASGTVYKLSPVSTPPPPPGQAVTSLSLINADTDQPITGYDPLNTGATLNLATLPTRNLSIRANTNPATVGSVRFNYDGNPSYKTENVVPYVIAGDQGSGDILPWTLAAGSHSLTVTPYTASNGGGTAGTAISLNFSVTDSGTGGGGTGLKGQYYDNQDFTSLKTTRTDATVDFNWGSSTPSGTALTSPDTFTVRWTGQVQAQYSETYTFYTSSDDGIRLWVNGVQIVNNWTDHSRTDNSGTIALVAGQKYDIKLEFYENGGDAVSILGWSSPSQARQVIPTGRLYPAP